MHNGKQHTVINHDTVQSALNDLLYSPKQHPPNPLQFLLLIDLELVYLDVPVASRRQFALDAFLVKLITQEYLHHRHIHKLNVPPENLSFFDAKECLQSDSRTGSIELMVWGLLYYRYVTIELNISQQDFTDVLNVDSRSLRRYQAHAIKRLTNKIAKLEASGRKDHRQRNLYAELPNIGTTKLFGRGEAFANILSLLKTNPTHHIQITGAAGVGKTVFAEHVIKALIDSDAIDQLIWISNPLTLADIENTLIERLIEESNKITLRSILILRRVAVVIDGVENLQFSPEQLEIFINHHLAGAIVLLVSRKWLDLPNVRSFPLFELQYADIKGLVIDLIGEGKQTELPTLIDDVWERGGGNPSIIKVLCHHTSLFSLHYASIHSVDRIYMSIYAALEDNLKRTWLSFLLCPPSGILSSMYCAIWSSKLTRDLPEKLLVDHLIEVSGEKWFITSSTRHFLRKIYDQDIVSKQYVGELLNDLAQSPKISPDQLPIIEHLLLKNQIVLDSHLHNLLIDKYWQYGIAKKHYAVWANILASHYLNLSERWMPKIGYGICLRHLSDFEKATQVFNEVAADAGRAGDFDKQNLALIELAVLFRITGQIDKSVSILNRLEKIIPQDKIGSTEIRDRLQLEKAHILVYLNMNAAAEAIIIKLPTTPQSLLLRSEIYLRCNHVPQLTALVEQAYKEFSDDIYLMSRIYTLWGQHLKSKGDWHQAQAYLGLALTLSERNSTDLLGLAQAQSNMGALLIELEEFDQAENLLRSAEHIQEVIQHRVALFATRHNLSLLNTRLAH